MNKLHTTESLRVAPALTCTRQQACQHRTQTLAVQAIRQQC
jgi:hypothetical protein